MKRNQIRFITELRVCVQILVQTFLPGQEKGSHRTLVSDPNMMKFGCPPPPVWLRIAYISYVSLVL